MHTLAVTHAAPLQAWFKHNLKCWQAFVFGGLSGGIRPPCRCLLKAQCKCQWNNVIHRALLITHCISMHYLHQAYPPSMHSQARVTNKQGINEWQKSNIYARAPKAGHVTAGAPRRQLPAACPPEGKWNQQHQGEKTEEGWRLKFTVAGRNAAGNSKVYTVFVHVCLPCWFSACCFVCVQKCISFLFSYTRNQLCKLLFQLYVANKCLHSL